MSALPAAAKDCKIGHPDKLVLISWSSKPGKLGPYIEFAFRSDMSKSTRSIDATLVFEGVEGSELANLKLDPDIKIAAGETKTMKDAMIAGDLLEATASENVIAKICTRSVEFDDGTFSDF
ncbi:hypothetical protein ACFSQQ_13670 [Mesorhizobium kowhaii]|uniref:hypothetical protein n=1 Tax=Mesorhizobium kowhaii TaxID=1300272 RepID=UPI0035ED5668